MTKSRGAAALFDSLLPHRSGRNRSSRSRRALYLTYDALSEGDLRDAYYAAGEQEMRGAAGETGRISNIGHFRGIAVEEIPGR